MSVETIALQGFGGLKLAADVYGLAERPTVVLLPAVGQARAFWRGAAVALAEAGRYAVCIDLRGHGDSEHARDGRYDFDVYVEDLRAVLAALPNRAVVVAAGLSALVAIAVAGEGPGQLVSGLVLMDATIWFDETEVARQREIHIRRADGFDGPADALDEFAALHPGEPQPMAGERLLAAFATGPDGRLQWRGDVKALGATSIRNEEARLADAAARVAAPVALIRGALNDTVSDDAMRRLRDAIPGAELTEIEGAGHYAATDREDAFNSVLLDFLERRAPRQPLTYIGGSEPRVLRDALGCFGTGVTIVTTVSASGEPVGLTANSFTSVSLDPPLILFSLGGDSSSVAHFKDTGRFAVNVLHIGQQPLAARFTQRGVSRFEGVEWAILADGGSPILAGSLASFDCRTFAAHEGGDHLIFIGQVEHAWFEPHRDPLLYFRGKYQRLHFA